MRSDEHLKFLTLERHQKFFLEAWYNMTLETSLDSHRVKCMNSSNIVRELLTVMNKTHGKMEDDIGRIRKETISILSEDPLLKTSNWIKDTKTLLDLLGESENNKNNSTSNLVEYYGRDFKNRLYAEYINDIVKELMGILCNADEGTEGFYQRIHDLTGSLLSSLIDAGYSIEALYSVYVEVLVPRGKRSYSFVKRLDFACKLVSNVDKRFKIFLRLDGVKRADAIPQTIGNVQLFFNSALPLEANCEDTRVKKFFTPGLGRAFAFLEVTAKDLRSAGSIAHEDISSLIDLIRFEFENSIIKVDETFVGFEVDSKKQPRVSKIPSKVPNSRRNIDENGLGEFIASVSTVLLSENLADEGRDRIKSAFRLYRAGLDTTSFEQKVVNWWTALEYLIRGSSNTGKIGEAVENYLTPILCLDYLSKHIDSYRRTFTSFKETEKKDDATFPNYKDSSLSSIYEIMKNEAELDQLIAHLNASPLISFKVKKYGKKLSKTTLILILLEEHEQRVKWHIQRIYRARCDIVHSAERILNSSLLCANLEFYLKSLLASLLDEFAKTPSLTGPKEFLDRSQHLYAQMKLSLKTNDDSILKSNLHTGIW